jgi:hypothetical protein
MPALLARIEDAVDRALDSIADLVLLAVGVTGRNVDSYDGHDSSPQRYFTAPSSL